MTPSSDPPAGIAGDPAGEVETNAPEPARSALLAPLEGAATPPVRKRPRPGERRIQILETLATMLQEPGADRITTAALAARLDVGTFPARPAGGGLGLDGVGGKGHQVRGNC